MFSVAISAPHYPPHAPSDRPRCTATCPAAGARTAAATPTTSSTAATAATAATPEQRSSASGCKHGSADHHAEGLSNVSFHDSFGEIGNERDAERQQNAGQAKKQRPCDAVESADEISAIEYGVHGVHVDRRHQRSENRVQHPPGIENHQIHQILSCHHAKAEGGIQRQHEWPDDVQDRAVERIEQ